MKKIILTILVCVVVLETTGCANKKILKYNQEEINMFNATILECNQNSMIVIPGKDEFEYKVSDKFSVAFVDSFKSCNANEKVRITYQGDIMESYPAQIKTTKIELTVE